MKRTTTTSSTSITPEHKRLLEHRENEKDWKRWGPYVSERAWGTVREDYSPDGSAWDFLPHDAARSKAYRWGEDGLAAICDREQTLCFAVALWNGRDPILKERLFGLSGPEGNHGEDVKELYYYLDSTPTHSYMKYLYKYPQAEFPYAKLVQTSRQRTEFDREYELLDTGVFSESRYFDVFVEYAKAAPEDLLIRITVHNRGPETATLHLIPHLWFRNTWAWTTPRGEEPLISEFRSSSNHVQLHAQHETLLSRFLYADGQPRVLFTNNETNAQRLYGVIGASAFTKDAFHEAIIRGHESSLCPEPRGTKAGLHYTINLAAGQSHEVRLRLCPDEHEKPWQGFTKYFTVRQREADRFYDSIHPVNATPEERRIQRQAFAGMLWNKQYYEYDVRLWLRGDNANRPPASRLKGRNKEWEQFVASDILSMPDKWEYPWFAAWDLAFHVIPLAMIDVDFAKDQLELLICERLMHPNGQIPAYEWEFSDVNPPVQAWAVWRVYNIEKHANDNKGDTQFLERCYHKLLLNFTWWVNRKDSQGRNIFQGGFLGLDNISVFDRSKPLPNGGHFEQADATGWMALFSLNMMAIGLELAQADSVYEHLGIKFFEHFMAIASAINREEVTGMTLWDPEDGWYYDSIHGVESPHSSRRLKVRSMVGLIPLFAAQILDHSWFEKLPAFKARYEWLFMNRPDLEVGIMCIWTPDGQRCLLSIADFDQLQKILRRALDESEFLSKYGVRSLSRHHLAHPYVLALGDREWTVRYEPGESTTRMFGGNSNWRGPIWFPTAYMLITALRVYDRFYGEMFKIECPTGSGQLMTLNEIAIELGRRLISIFLPDETGQRPCCSEHESLAHDPHFQNDLLFHEFFHGETGQGLGASHQTGWTGLVAKLIEQQVAHRLPPSPLAGEVSGCLDDCPRTGGVRGKTLG